VLKARVRGEQDSEGQGTGAGVGGTGAEGGSLAEEKANVKDGPFPCHVLQSPDSALIANYMAADWRQRVPMLPFEQEKQVRVSGGRIT